MFFGVFGSVALPDIQHFPELRNERMDASGILCDYKL